MPVISSLSSRATGIGIFYMEEESASYCLLASQINAVTGIRCRRATKDDDAARRLLSITLVRAIA